MLLKATAATGVLILSAFFALVVATAPDEPPVHAPNVVSDRRLLPMLEDHARMTERMQVATPNGGMTHRMLTDPMWSDWSEDMVREQEAYQAQLDRMLARR